MRIIPLPLASNCYIADIGNGKCLIVDPGSDGDAILRACELQGLSPVAILFTHMHFDHIMATNEINSELKKPLPMYIHSEDKQGLTIGMLNLSSMATGKDYEVQGEVTTLSDGEKLIFGDVTLEVMHTPGHTPGSVCYICHEDGIVFTGDTLFQGTIGRTDFPGGSFATIKKSLERITTLNHDFVLYPGHGETTDIKTEIQDNPYLKNDYPIW